MKTKTPVAIVRCPDYDDGRVAHAVQEALEMLPEFKTRIDFVDEVFLKINLTQLCPPESAVITHPSVIRATGDILTEWGHATAIGESSGGSGWPLWRRLHKILFKKLQNTTRGMKYEELEDFYTHVMNVGSFGELFSIHAPGLRQPFTTPEELGIDTDIDFYTSSGIKSIAAQIGARLVYLDMESTVPVKPLLPSFLSEVTVCRSIFDARQIISVSKFKTHADAILTGAMKNFFGIVPTPLRAPHHSASMFGNMFNEMLVDVFSVVKPAPLAITDAVYGMEGRGPLEGPPRHLGLIIASVDCVAHDAVMAALVGLHPYQIPMVRLASELGLGEGTLENIEIRGVPIGEAASLDWDLERNSALRNSV